MTYELIYEDLTGLGGSMGTERTFTKWRKFFSSMQKAKKYAEKDYGKPLEWFETDDGVRSNDLSYVMYYITRVKVIE